MAAVLSVAVANTYLSSFRVCTSCLSLHTTVSQRIGQYKMPSDKQTKFICSTEVLFQCLLSVSKTRYIDIKLVLEHELAAVPPTLFNDDGSMGKTNKSCRTCKEA